MFFFFKQKTSYELRISDWRSDVCSSDLLSAAHRLAGRYGRGRLIDHLLGKTKDVSDREAALSTWGIGQELSQARWRDLTDQLLFEGLLREDPNSSEERRVGNACACTCKFRVSE